MRKIQLLLAFLFIALTANAQLVTLSPEKPTFIEEAVLVYDAALGNGALKDCDCDIYAHTGLLTGESANEGDWKKVVADWGDNQAKLKLKSLGNNKYELRFKIAELYGIPATGGNVTALNFVFRNADGSKVGKDNAEKDIYIYFKEASFRPQPTALAISQTKTPEWTKYASIYEVNIRQYTKEGTINAFSEHLPRLRELGVDILWLMPIQPIGVKDRKGSLGSYYSIQDYTAVNPEFGTVEDFKRFVNKAHGMGFKIVLDWVANHTSRDNVWISGHQNWYNYDKEGNIIAPYDWSDVADLNYEMYYMREAMTDAMLFWVKECDIDGFRCDVAGEVPVDFWNDTRAKLDAEKEVWMLAEDGSKMWLLNTAFNTNYGWEFHHIMNEIAKGNQPASVVVPNLQGLMKKYPSGTYPMHFITNHDENSWQGTVFERLGEGHKAFAVLTFTIPGIPLIYSGQEAGMKKRLEFFEKDPIDWSDMSLTPFYTKLNQLKAENPALWNGNAGGDLMEIKNDKSEKVVAFSRTQGDSKIVTIINLSGEMQDVSLSVANDAGIYRDYFTNEKITLTKRSKMKLEKWAYKVLVFEAEAPKEERKLETIEKTGTGLRIDTNDGSIFITPYSKSTLEVEFLAIGEKNPTSFSIAETQKNNKKKVPTTLNEKGNIIEYSTGELTVTITKSPFNIAYSYNLVPLFSEEQGFFDSGINKGFRLNLDATEKLTGGGSRVLGMDRRGQRLELYNKASYGYETKADLMYYSLPVVISSKKYMVIFDNVASGFLDLGKTETNILQFEAVGGRTSYLVVAADSWQNLATNYTELTGRQPLVPKWILGNIASRMGYHSQAEVENVVNQYEKQDIPLDGVVLDLYWFGSTLKGTLGNLDWNRDSFPEPEKMLADFNSKGVKTVLITEPFIIKDTKTYQEVIDKKLVGTTKNNEPYHFDFYFGNTLLLDIFKPETQDWFWNIYKKNTAIGVAGWWGDLGEPEVHPNDLLHVNGRADEVHNAYGHVWAKTIFEGYKTDFPNKRPVILMRSGFVGSQRYGMVPWSGDVNRSWGGLKPQVEISLTMGMQGLALMHSDLGGFAGDYEDSELYIRWLQYGVFQLIYRTHAQEEVPAEPIFWDENTKDLARKAIKLRYELLPYNYTLFHENSTTGVPMMRPLFYEEDNLNLFENTTSYLWGNAFLITPITEKGVSSQAVYLPTESSGQAKGSTWINYWNGKKYSGGQTVNVAVDSTFIPVFVKAGSFIPMVEAFQNTEKYNSEILNLHYYHDKTVATSKGTFYDDDGKTNNAFANKQYEILNFSSTFDNGKLNITIEPTGYDYDGKPKKRIVNVMIHGLEGSPNDVRIGDEPSEISYDAMTKVLNVGVAVSEEKVVIRIQ
jgi:oligosaccharide 4-alpha-D-glucosyltransferase